MNSKKTMEISDFFFFPIQSGGREKGKLQEHKRNRQRNPSNSRKLIK
jgi:hypothetical protein